MQVSGVVSFKCESVATLDPVTFDTPESFVALNKWTAKKAGSISFDFRTTEPNGLMLFSHGKPRQQQRKDSRSPPTVKVVDPPGWTRRTRQDVCCQTRKGSETLEINR